MTLWSTPVEGKSALHVAGAAIPFSRIEYPPLLKYSVPYRNRTRNEVQSIAGHESDAVGSNSYFIIAVFTFIRGCFVAHHQPPDEPCANDCSLKSKDIAAM